MAEMTAQEIPLATDMKWKTVELRSQEFHRCVAVAILRKDGARSGDSFLELAPDHDYIYTTDCYRWLDIHGTHRIRGCERFLLAKYLP